MEPIPFLALNDKFCRVGKVCCSGGVISRLRDYVYHEVPGARLTYLRQRARDRLLCFIRGCEISHRVGGCSGEPGNIGSGQRGATERIGARGLLNNGLGCGERVVWADGAPNADGPASVPAAPLRWRVIRSRC